MKIQIELTNQESHLLILALFTHKEKCKRKASQYYRLAIEDTDKPSDYVVEYELAKRDQDECSNLIDRIGFALKKAFEDTR